MFKTLKHFWSSQGKARRPKASVRLRAAVEPLEWRCMLSIAPSTIDNVLDHAAEYAPDFRDIPIVIDSGIVGRVGDYWHDLSPRDQLRWREIIADLTNPGSGGIVFPLPGLELGEGDHWIELPGNEPSQDPAITLPDPYDPGGLIDTGDLTDQSELYNNGPRGGNNNNNNNRDVFELLSSLQYLPSSLKESSNELIPKKADTKLESQTIEASAANATAKAAVEDNPDGGMVALTREAQFSEVVSSTPTALNNRQSLWQLPVKMDQVYGKFQVFELSTGDETVPAVSAPAEETNASSKVDAALNDVRSLDVDSSIDVIVPVEIPLSQFRTLASLDKALTLPAVISDEDAEVEAIDRPVLDPAATAIFIVSAASVLRPSQTRKIETYLRRKVQKSPSS
jgi:hypothetical protein